MQRENAAPVYRCEICLRSNISRLWRSTVWKLRPLWLCHRCRKLGREIFKAGTSVAMLRANAARLQAAGTIGTIAAGLERRTRKARRESRNGRANKT